MDALGGFRNQDDILYRYFPPGGSVLSKDTRAIPFVVSCLAFTLQVVHGLAVILNSFRKRRTASGELSTIDAEERWPVGLGQKLRSHVHYYGGYTIFGFMVARLTGSVALLYLSAATLHGCPSNPAWTNLDALTECPEGLMTISFLYASLLSLVALVFKEWRTSTTRYSIVVLASAGAVYAYRDIWPIATYNSHPADIAEGKILYIKLAVLAVTSVIIPLFIPRQYVPVDPKNPMPITNPEQTASLFALMTYTYLDSTIFLGYKVPHLRPEQLPPLADYDAAKYRTENAFPHLDRFHGAKRRSLFMRFMRVYRNEYLTLAVMVVIYALSGFAAPIGINRILNYMEQGGRDAEMRPWFWITWLFFGPMTQTVAFQWYIYIATRTLARTEGLVTHLVFEHSLRIRLKAETSNHPEKEAPTLSGDKIASGAATPDSTSDTPLNSELAPRTENASESSEASTAVASREPSTASSHATIKVSAKGKAKAAPEEPEKDDKKRISDSNLIGKINNLVTTDLNVLVRGRDFLLVVLYVPLQITLCVVFLYQVLGWSAFVGIGIMVALFPVPGYIAKKIRQAQAQVMRKTDARVQAVSEAVNVLRMIKLFGWEKKMSDRLKETRDEELKQLWRVKVFDLLGGLISYLFPTLTMLGTYMTYALVMKGELNASKIFSSMTVFSMLREQLSRLLYQGSLVIQAKVSLDRIQEFLDKTELLDSFAEVSPESEIIVPANVPSSSEIGFRDASFSWSLEEDSGTATPSSRIFKLRVNGELLFKRNRINLIIGPTGSGKTSMLMALLGEMHFVPSGPNSWFNLPREGGVAYAAQESWVQNETIRNNILFGSPYDEERYNKVIKQCALERDLELFDAGDATEVGERGLTLSGGQKARVTLARAIYSHAQVILLDDVFAALDVHTSSWIMDHCFGGDLVKDRTILLVTHNIALASPVADFVVSIGLDGRVQSQGTEVALAIAKSSTLAKEAEEDREATEISKENIDLPAKKPADGKLVVAEEIAVGHVSWKSMNLLLSSMGGGNPVLFFLTIIGLLFLNEWSVTFQTWFLGHWGSQYETHPPSEVAVTFYLSVYSSLLIVTFVLYSGSYFYSVYGSMRASRSINNQLIDSILGSTLRWLDETPTARIIARCTQDIRSIDGPIPQILLWLLDMISGMLTKLGAVVLFTPIFFFPGFGAAVIGFYLGNMYLKAQLSVKRESSNARSPMLAHFSAAIHGLVSIRAYGAQNAFKVESLTRIDRFTRIARMSYDLNRWIGVRIDALGAAFTVALASYLVYGPPVGAANTGFSLAMAVEFTQTILYLVRTYNDFEVNSNSLERIQGYLDIEHEPAPTEAGKPPAAWPTSGSLRAEKLSARYSESGPKVLHEISFEIRSGERIGVVGRTGSGKSSLTLALLRCILTEGTVYYDGLPTSKINLDALRTNITIIPQTPELLSGTLRQNLDPFDQNDDAALNDALRAAGLFSLQDESDEARITLDTKIAGGGGNLSVGQRQILALARAMVRGSKLLILDEATSAIDYKTDAIIQNTLRSQLANDVTVITVAHRLQTIMDADQIMVLDDGRIAEFGKPKELLKNEKGMLRALVDGSGDKDNLYSLADALD